MNLDDSLPSLEEIAPKVGAARALLHEIARSHSPAVFANSFGAEDMVLMHLIARDQLAIEMFAIDTGRLPGETYELMARAERHYGLSAGIVFPDAGDVERLVHEHGINGFYESIEARKACCRARKIGPLKRALAGKQAWVTGLRAAQGSSRSDIQQRSVDADNGLLKFSPLAEWTDHEVWAFLRGNDVPYNSLHDRGFPSLGCAPCTRAIGAGEDIRAGRWWWENTAVKECGLHWVDGRVQRTIREPADSTLGHS